MKIEIYTKKTFSLFREDTSDKMAFRTQISSSTPSIVYFNLNNNPQNTEFYDGALLDFDYAKNNSTRIDLTKGTVDLNERISIRKYLINQGYENEIDAKFLEKIYNNIHSTYHRYR